jgi:hypothetical protein
LFLAVTMFVVSLIIFAITQILPGDVATMIVGQSATPEDWRRSVSARARPARHRPISRLDLRCGPRRPRHPTLAAGASLLWEHREHSKLAGVA